MSWQQDLEDRAEATLRAMYGLEWGRIHGIQLEVQPWLHYSCSKCDKHPTCLNIVLEHIQSKDHERRMRDEHWESCLRAEESRRLWEEAADAQQAQQAAAAAPPPPPVHHTGHPLQQAFANRAGQPLHPQVGNPQPSAMPPPP
eukprot:CAMPEP_0168395180 /NCGR_PEP_ID=MMETSP0228-20121227/19915_1 /TAXON_ID=133427 /ORGANISM="Protoceratium reticulatum, Strain CCCM 535 (=CCMP 1889)" /LENGTH=142 /DNA_ID=CAMNT_0008408613 /DNA_START=125 /DNA_END=549 /DNA_ORIENTATION=-